MRRVAFPVRASKQSIEVALATMGNDVERHVVTASPTALIGTAIDSVECGTHEPGR
jgi:hypothetical protein